MRMVRALLAGALIVILTAACTNAGQARQPTLETRDEQRHVTIRVRGIIEADVKGLRTMRFIEREMAGPETAVTSLATISTMKPFEFEPGRGLIVGVSLVGDYTGDGTYTIGAREEITKPAPGEAPDLSVVRLEVYDLTTELPTLLERHDNDVPCTLTVEDDATVGHVACEHGSFSLWMRWIR